MTPAQKIAVRLSTGAGAAEHYRRARRRRLQRRNPQLRKPRCRRNTPTWNAVTAPPSWPSRKAKPVEVEPDREMRERIELRGKASLTSYLRAALVRAAGPTGPEAELQAASRDRRRNPARIVGCAKAGRAATNGCGDGGSVDRRA